MRLAVRLKTQHATLPTVSTEVFIDRQRGRTWDRVSSKDHQLVVPAPANWTPDTVRATLHALRRFLPSHELADLSAAVTIRKPRRGYRPPQASLAVRWRHVEAIAWIPSLRSSPASDQPDASLWFSDPMVAWLRELDARGRFLLASVEAVDAIVAETAPPLSEEFEHALAQVRSLIAR